MTGGGYYGHVMQIFLTLCTVPPVFMFRNKIAVHVESDGR